MRTDKKRIGRMFNKIHTELDEMEELDRRAALVGDVGEINLWRR